MSSYLVIHDIQSFEQHPRWIGRQGAGVPREFERLARGDGIVYYCKGDQVITGTFRVASRARTIQDDSKWVGPHVVVDIKPVVAAAPPYVPVKRLLEQVKTPPSIFPSRKIEGVRLKGRTLIRIWPVSSSTTAHRS